MADMELEIGLPSVQEAAIDVGADGNRTVRDLAEDALEVTDIKRPGERTTEAAAKPAPEVGKEHDKPEEHKAETQEDIPDLGEYNPADAATLAKYDAHYYTPEGSLNKDALTKEFWGNEGKGLKEGTYAYLTDRLGVSKEFVQEVERGLVANQQGQVQAIAGRVHEMAGGKASYDAAMTWAKGEGGYTKEQQARYDALSLKGGPDFDDAVLALVARHAAANPGAAGRALPNLRPRRAVSPARNATAGRGETPPGARSQAEAFADNRAYLAALREAGQDRDKQAAVRDRLRASHF